jgi:hypothetical protein
MAILAYRIFKQPPLGRRILYLHNTGPMICYSPHEGLLYVSDLNPEVNTKWRMSRWEMAKLGWRFLLAAVRRA